MAGRGPILLEPVDRAEVTIVVDNFVDVLMAGAEGVRRYLATDWGDRRQLIAEHGFSALVTVESHGRRSSVLYDGGLTPTALARNLDVLQVEVRELRALVISHGHADHHGGLEALFQRHGRARLPLVIHPEAWRERKLVFPTGAELRLPPPNRHDLEAEGVEVIEEAGQSLLLDSTVLVSGQVERLTEFEQGFPIHYAQTKAGWEPDPMIWDDQNLIVNVRGKGLVVVSGCSHAGAVNVVRNATADRRGARRRLHRRPPPHRRDLRTDHPTHGRCLRRRRHSPSPTSALHRLEGGSSARARTPGRIRTTRSRDHRDVLRADHSAARACANDARAAVGLEPLACAR
jgi:7,8-dihydropterin-6-yl-methyl-4-(beta-D-ribofuranosyl)aminobenzene 5'-phosphate synthase